MKKIVMTGGGTAGHVTPNIAMLPRLREMGYEISYIGTYDGIEKKLIEDAGIPYYGISSGKLRRYFSLRNFSDPFRVMKGFRQAKKLMKKLQPDVVFSKGGFVSVPVVLAPFLSEIHSAGELTNAQEIGSVNELGLEGRAVDQGLKGLHRTQVGIQSKTLADRQEALLRPDRRIRVIVIFRISHGAEKHRITVHAYGMCLFRIRIPEMVYGTGAYICKTVLHLVTEAAAHRIHGLNCLVHFLGTYAVSRQFRDSEFHMCILKLCFL